MASLSAEEENYVRMSLLLTGISPRAARTFFDSEFAPANLDATIKKEKKKLHELKEKHIINQSQWNMLFPRSPDVLDSKTFDVTLMILLLRNLTPMNPPLSGFDKLPSVLDTTQAADLARIKHYRNELAHLQNCKVDTAFFTTAWTDITGAIGRLGGHQMKQECDNLKTKPLDQTNQEILIEIKRANDEIKELKKGLKRLHTEMEKCNESLQEDHKKMKEEYMKVPTEIEIMKNYQEDTVPWNIRARIKQLLKTWKENDVMFIKTRAADHVFQCTKENSCVTITASSGVGKTATLRHVAIQMEGEGYDVIMVTEPAEIVNYNNPKKKTLFVFDDLCGNYSVDQSDIKKWDPVKETIQNILDEKQTKILAACRLQVYQNQKFKSLSVFKSCVCNLLSENLCLSKTEKQYIAELYLKTKASKITAYYDLYDCFPLLCKLYNNNPNLDITDFFKNPFSVYEAEIDKYVEKEHYAKYCALALCVMFNNKLKEEIFTKDENEETRNIIANTCEACRLNRGTARLVLQDELDSLTGTFIIKEEKVYKTLHDKLFDFLVYYFGQKMIYSLIKNAESGLIKERFLMDRNDVMDQFITIIPAEYHQIYIQRLIDDWLKGKVQCVFSNINMKIPQFRQKFFGYLHKLDKSYQRQLAHISDFHTPRSETLFQCFDDNDDDWYDTALLHCCYLGDISLVKWCCANGVNVNRCTYTDQSPLIIACEFGHIELVKMLLDGGADFSKCNVRGKSPVMMACEHGHIEIVKILLDRGANYDTFDKRGRSSVMNACEHGQTEIVKILLDRGAKCEISGQSLVSKASEHGHIEIVKMLLDRGINWNKLDNFGQSPVMIAYQHGHIEIVKMLLERGADCNKCDVSGQSPLSKACEHGHTEIVKILLDRGADCSKCDVSGQSLVSKASAHGHIEIVKMLLDRGINWNKLDNFGQSPVMIAYQHGHIEIVNMLLERGIACNKLDKFDQSLVMIANQHSRKEIVKMLLERGAIYDTFDERNHLFLMMACEHGYIEIVKILLDRGAIYDTFDESGHSPLMMACEHGYTEIVKMLLDRGADCNKCDRLGKSTLMIACEHGHTEIIKMMLDRGADCNKCYDGWSPVLKACERGYTEIVKMLLDRGADYNKCDWFGRSPVMEACKHGHTKIVEILLEREPECYKYNRFGQSPLMIADEHHHKGIVKMLLDRL